MHRNGCRVAMVVGVVGILAALPSVARAMPDRICGRDASVTAQAIAARARAVTGGVATLLAVNDVRCEALEGRAGGVDMANVAVQVDTGGERLYGIYHVHLSDENEIASAAAILPLRPLPEGTWRQAWCRLIAAMYPRERAEQGCPE